MKRIVTKGAIIWAVMSFAMVLQATPTISSVTAQQRYPWNGLVDITITLQCTVDEAEAAQYVFVATNSATKAEIPIVHITRNGANMGLGNVWSQKFIWDAKADVGIVKIDDVALTVDTFVGVQLWENGPYWATCNVGASKPEECGYYFWWGDTVGYTNSASGWNAVDGSMMDFSFSSSKMCPTYKKSTSQLYSEGYIDSTGNLVAAHDAATAYLNTPWRMPAVGEFSALIKNCTTTWEQLNGVWGRRVTGKGDYASKSIFLPAAGYGYGFHLFDLDSNGYYWSSTPSGTYGNACFLELISDSLDFGTVAYYCYYGRSVRPLLMPAMLAGTTFCAVTTHLPLDCSGAKVVDSTRLFVYDAAWYTDGVKAKIVANGQEIVSGAVGSYAWIPSSEGCHLLTLNVYNALGKVVGSESVFFLSREDLTELVIPDGTTEIGEYAFAGGQFTSVTIPNSVTNVATTAFTRCTNIVEVSLGGWMHKRKVHVCDEPEGDWSSVGDGQYRSKAIENNGSTEISVRLNLKESRTGTFRWKVSSESGYDKLEYSVDGTRGTDISGLRDWETKELSLDAGEHTVIWRYYKDSSQAAGDDCGWVDISELLELTELELIERTTLATLFPDSYALIRSVRLVEGFTEIVPGMFAGCVSLETVAVPSEMVRFGADAFAGCDAIKRVDIASVEQWMMTEFANAKANPLHVGAALYVGGEDVTELVIPDGTTEIGEYAFAGGKFTSVTIPNSVTNVAPTAFEECKNVVEVTLGDSFVQRRMVGIGVDGTIKNLFPKSYGAIKTVRLNAGTVSVNPSMFADCVSMETIDIPNSVTNIGTCAFADCAAMTHLTLPVGLKAVGKDAFIGCENLTRVDVSSMVGWASVRFGNTEANPLRVGAALYVGDEEVTKLVIPDGTTEIGEYAFAGGQFTSVTIPNSVTNIGACAFADCAAMTRVTLPVGLKAVGKDAFIGCENLTRVDVSSMVDWTSVRFGNAEANPLHTGAALYVGGEEVMELVIPDGTTEIGEYAFAGGKFTSVTIPNSVTNVATTAFAGCSCIQAVALDCANSVDERDIAGLWQARFDGYKDWSSPILYSESCSRVSGVVMGYTRTSTSATIVADPIFDGGYNWNNSDTTFGYCGYMFMKAGRRYVFGKDFDDAVYLKVDGTVVMDHAVCNQFTTRSYDVTWTGWHEIEVRLSDETSLKGPRCVTWSSMMGLGWRDDGVTSAQPEAGWSRLMDPGDGSLFRIEPYAMWRIAELFPNSYAGIKSMAFLEGTERISSSICASCALLESVTIPASVKSVGEDAFLDCANLKRVDVESLEDWLGIEFANTAANPLSCGATLYVNGEKVDVARVTFDANGGEDVVPRDLPYGVAVGALPRPVRGNDEFAGWFTEPLGGEKIDETYLIQEDVTVYAHWLRTNGGPYTEVRDGVAWTFMVANGAVSIGGTGSYSQPAIDPATRGELAIPVELGGRPVTSIKDGAFYYCDQLTSIVVPSNVTSVGYSAFRGCTGVTNLVVNTSPDSYCSWMEWFTDCRSVKTATVPGSSSSYADSYGYYTLYRLFPDLETLTFTEGTVSIPYQMCAGLTKLSQVELPSSLKVVGRYAFRGCSFLEEIDLPEGLTTVGDYAFSDCVSLVSADLPSTMTSMGRDVFAGCKKLIIENLYIPGETWSIDYDAYYEMEGIKNVVIGEGVYSIGDSAFEGCSGMTNVVFPSSLQRIGWDAFRNCVGLGEVTLPENLMDLGPQAFYGCTNLTTVTILGDRLWLSGDPFANCVNLALLNVRIGSSMSSSMFRSSGGFRTPLTVNVLEPCSELPRYSFDFCTFMKELILPEGLAQIGCGAVERCTALESVKFPTSLENIDDLAFVDCSNLEKAALPKGLKSIGVGAFYGCSQLETPVQIPNSVTNIGELAFYPLDVLDLQFEQGNENYVVEDGVLYKLEQGEKNEIVIVSRSAQGEFVAPETIKRIAPYAFSGCDGISAIVLPEGLVEIGTFAFEGCNGLTHLTVPASVCSLAGSSIRDVPFEVIDIDSANPIYYKDGRMIYRRTDVGIEVVGVDKDYEGELAFVDDIVGIGESACRGCTNVMSVIVPDSVLSIGKNGFAYCGQLESIELGENVTRIGNEAFYYCSNLVSVVIPESVQTIGSCAFGDCKSLTCAEILGGEVGSSAFYGCDVLEDVYLGYGVTKIASSAFSNCDSLERVKIDSVAELGSSAFYSCDALESAEVRSSVIGNYAFEYCTNLARAVLGPGVGSVGSYAFYQCSGMDEIWISSSVTNVGSQAFYGCSSLKTIHVSSDGDVDAVKQMLGKSGLNVDNVTFDLFDEPIDMPIINPLGGTVFRSTNCQVSISCTTPGAAIYYRLGAEPKASSRFLYSEPFTITETSTIYSYAVKNGRYSPTNVVTLTRGGLLTFVEAASVEGVEMFDFGGDADWHAVDDVAKVGEASVRSGAIEDDQVSWFTTEVEGPGTLSFWWKASCEGDELQDFDHLVFSVDDAVEGEVARLDGITGWEPVTVTIPAGTHTLYWAYVKDECEFAGEDCGWVDGIVWTPDVAPAVTPTIEGDSGATVTGDAETGFVVKPSVEKAAVEVTIPQGVDAAKVTVEVSPKVASVKPNGAKVKIVSGKVDITEFLNVPAADGNGVVDLSKAKVKEEIVKETLDPEKGAVVNLSGGPLGTADPVITTAPTREGLFYTFSEGRTLDGMERSAGKPGDGKPWSPEIKVKGGNSAFYSIGVGKGE